MGYDTFNIVSMNSSRPGHQQLSQAARRGYLSQVIDGEKPDLCLLPGDTDDIKKNVVVGYDQYATGEEQKTVLLYDTNRLRLQMPEPSLNSTIGAIKGIDFGQIVCPKAEVLSLQPNVSVIKQFSIITWEYTMCMIGSQTDRTTQAENLIILAQRLAMSRGIPVLIGGDLNLDINSLREILKKHSQDCQQELNMRVHEQSQHQGYLPSMTNGAIRTERHLVKMELYGCKRQAIVKTLEDYNPCDYFIASKELQLKQATFLDFPSATGRKIQLHPALQEHRPTKTQMEIPVRPPKHHGG